MKAAATRLDDASVGLLAEDAKLALVATVADGGLPHLTLITSLQAKGPDRLMFGQFCEGLSKTQMASNPHVGFLALDRGRRWIRGKARWTGTAKQGEDYEAFNRKPMFRYNAYFGIHTVHYLDVVEAEGARRLAAAPLVLGAAVARVKALLQRGGEEDDPITRWSRRLLARPATLKFLSWVDADGYPRIAPAVAAAANRTGRIVVAPTACREELARIPSGLRVALFGIDLEMCSVLVRGSYGPLRGRSPLATATIDVDWVYNSMPPKHGQVYPPLPLHAVRFGDRAPLAGA